MQLGALRSALSAKLQDGDLKIVSAFELAEHKTKTFAQTLGNSKPPAKCFLLKPGKIVILNCAARNIEGVELVLSHEVHPYHLLGAQRIFSVRRCLEA